MDTSNSVKNKSEKTKKYIGLIGKFQNIAQIEQAHHESFAAPGFSVDTVPANGPGYKYREISAEYDVTTNGTRTANESVYVCYYSLRNFTFMFSLSSFFYVQERCLIL